MYTEISYPSESPYLFSKQWCVLWLLQMLHLATPERDRPSTAWKEYPSIYPSLLMLSQITVMGKWSLGTNKNGQTRCKCTSNTQGRDRQMLEQFTQKFYSLFSFLTEPIDLSGRTSKDGDTFPPKRRYPSMGLHGVITQKTVYIQREILSYSYYQIALLSSVFLSSHTCYRMIRRGRRIMPSPTKNTHK